ncbi:YigZ family protein [Pseudemcibacter aquimaris]|uniref:YigZ family protein n=1 Tax=Pseudemcibacter aquimaris TaxID=2857064 RepID=UPI0020132CCC|nr:YigZ family protein [Pseudemcibacter aquimaris]MCC3860067.1 YigZ family protein [Pseudemcibacter aquimaris]WDU57396.1 YigZ family protein [Pseudemcibacter aquimaris]
MTDSTYHIPKKTVMIEDVIKRSRFIAHIGHTPDVKSAREFIAKIKEEYPDAGHNCWAYVAGAPWDSQVLGFSDDGEPNGTAGKPMLNVLMGSGIGEITGVVTRYFGGTKLGTGGLVRAYGGSLKLAMEELVTGEKIPEVYVTGISEYSHQSLIDKLLENYNIIERDVQFTDKISWDLKMDAREAPLAIAEIFDKTSGRIQFEVLED